MILDRSTMMLASELRCCCFLADEDYRLMALKKKRETSNGQFIAVGQHLTMVWVVGEIMQHMLHRGIGPRGGGARG